MMIKFYLVQVALLKCIELFIKNLNKNLQSKWLLKKIEFDLEKIDGKDWENIKREISILYRKF